MKLAKIAKAEQKLTEQITGRCDPAAGAPHTIGDLRGIGATVSEPLDVKNIDV